MSTTLQKRTWQEAIADAATLRELFDGSYERWEIAGSVRRRKAEVGDVEHVVIARWAEIPSFDLFATPKRTNLLLRRRDELLAAGVVAKHAYGTSATGAPKHRWGPTRSGMEFRGVNHELFGAGLDNWGSVFAIATGPADYSRMLVTRLHRFARRNKDGRVWACRPCHTGCIGSDCLLCDGTRLICTQALPTPEEEDFFRLAGLEWVEPEKRA